MPELPEVETNLRNLARWTVGRRIVAVKPPPGTREVCRRAVAHPSPHSCAGGRRRSGTRALPTAIRASLRHGLKVLARTEIPEYIEEGAPNPYYAYDRAGLPCRRCGTRLEGVRIGGRQSVFCPACQPVDGARSHR